MTKRIIFWSGVGAATPFIALSLVSLAFGVVPTLRPISLSFRFFAQDRSTDVLPLPPAGVGAGILVGSIGVLWLLRRFCYHAPTP